MSVKVGRQVLCILALISSSIGFAAEPVQQAPDISKAKPIFPVCTAAFDKDVRVEVIKTSYHKDKEFLPKDKNWAQLHIRIQNLSKDVVTISDVKAKQTTGTVIASAASAMELAKPPSITGEALKTTGIIGVGQFAGAFIFPPLALASSAFGLFGGLGKTESWGKRVEKINSRMLTAQSIAPTTAAEGLVYVPALSTFDSLVVFYSGSSAKISTLFVPCPPVAV